MKMKLGMLASEMFNNSFRKLMSHMRIPVKTAFKLRGMAKTINEEVSKFNETKSDYIQEYSLKDKKGNKQTDGNMVKLDPKKTMEFADKIRELSMIDVEIPELKMSELGDENNLTLTPEDYYNLEFILWDKD